MKNFLLIPFMIVLASCGGGSLREPPGEATQSGMFAPEPPTIRFDPWIGQGSKVNAQGFSIELCAFTLNNPHQSSYNPTEVKVDAIGRCPASSNPVLVTAFLDLEINAGGGWVKVTTGPKIRKEVAAAGAIWRQFELVAVAACVNGRYRSKLNIEVVNPGGAAVAVPLASPYSNERNVQCKPRAVSMVIDDTGSMAGVIGAATASLSAYINSIPEDEYTLWNLITFKDNVTPRGTTTDRASILRQVGSLFASGGDDCPENVLGGVSAGLSALAPYPDHTRDIIVITDASAQPGDVDALIASARLNNARVSVLLAGDCGLPGSSSASIASVKGQGVSAMALSSQVVLKRLADETGGKYFYIPGGTQADFEYALGQIFTNIRDTDPPVRDTHPPAVTLSVSPSSIWPPNHKMVLVTPTVSASDNLDPSPKVKFVGIKISEPDDGQGDGNTTGDVQITADGKIYVRAERSAKNNERTYTITYKATDSSGNVGYASATVTVPKSQSSR